MNDCIGFIPLLFSFYCDDYCFCQEYEPCFGKTGIYSNSPNKPKKSASLSGTTLSTLTGLLERGVYLEMRNTVNVDSVVTDKSVQTAQANVGRHSMHMH